MIENTTSFGFIYSPSEYNNDSNSSEALINETEGMNHFVFGALLFSTAVVCVAGNIMTISALVKGKLLRTPQYLYMLNMAVCNILDGCFVLITISISKWLYGNWWPLGRALCKFVWVADYWTFANSNLCIMVISYDRFLMVWDGVNYNLTQTRSRVLAKLALVWLLGFLFWVPSIVFYDVWRGYSILADGECDVEFIDDARYNSTTALMEFIFPVVIITVLNFATYIKIKQRSTKVVPDGSQPRQRMNAGSKKAARSLTTVVLVFAILWLPYCIVNVVDSFCADCVSYFLYDLVNWILWLTTAVNPFIYAVTNEKLRKLMWACSQQTSTGKTSEGRLRTVAEST